MDLQNLFVLKPLLNNCSQCFFFVLWHFKDLLISLLVSCICQAAQNLANAQWPPSALFISGYCGGFPLCCLQDLAYLQLQQIPMMDSANLRSCSQGWSARMGAQISLELGLFLTIYQTSHSRTHTHTLVVYPLECWSFSCIFCLIKY